MIEEELDLLYATGERLPNPDINILMREYFIGARITAVPENCDSPESDLERVISIRAEASPNYYTSRVEYPITKGIFAYGNMKDGEVSFDLYCPHPSRRREFPTQALKKGIAQFALVLLEEGYALHPGCISYTKPYSR